MGGGSSIRQRSIPSQRRRRLCRQWSTSLALIASLALQGGVVLAEDGSVNDLLSQARSAYRGGDAARALTLATRAVELDPQNPQSFLVRGQLHEMQGRHRLAIADYDAVLKLDPSVVEVYNRRGSEHFKLGHIEASIADFDRAIELNPGQEPYHWQRGISLLLRRPLREGAGSVPVPSAGQRQRRGERRVAFSLRRPAGGSEARPRQALLNIEGDRRVPMMEIYRLFRGEGSIDEVMQAARAWRQRPRGSQPATLLCPPLPGVVP